MITLEVAQRGKVAQSVDDDALEPFAEDLLGLGSNVCQREI